MGIPDVGGIDADQRVWPPLAAAAQVDDVGIGRVDRQDQFVIALGSEWPSPMIG